MSLSLFIVVLGGRSKKTNIEMHDVRWVLGEKIEDTFSELRAQWFGQKVGLHIDSYKCIKYIDGYRIIISERDQEIYNKNSFLEEKLWFVNLGGYDSKNMYENHYFTLIAAKKASEAKKKAKKSWDANYKNIHNDDCSSIKHIEQIDDVYSIQRINKWDINLIADEKIRGQKLIPDWYGYMRIDHF